MSSHTEGPWFLESTPTALWVGPKKAFSEKVADVVVRVETGPDYRQEYRDTAEANARLIAAAPELLSAIIDLADAARSACNAAQHSELVQALFDADYAIAKAHGVAR